LIDLCQPCLEKLVIVQLLFFLHPLLLPWNMLFLVKMLLNLNLFNKSCWCMLFLYIFFIKHEIHQFLMLWWQDLFSLEIPWKYSFYSSLYILKNLYNQFHNVDLHISQTGHLNIITNEDFKRSTRFNLYWKYWTSFLIISAMPKFCWANYSAHWIRDRTFSLCIN